MNTGQRFAFAGTKNKPNFFIGGINNQISSINDFTLLLERFTSIEDFFIGSDYISFFGEDIAFKEQALKNNLDLKYIVDLGCNMVFTTDVFRDSGITHIRSVSNALIGHRSFYSTPLEILYFPEAIDVGGYLYFSYIDDTLRILYAPKMADGINAGATNSPYIGSSLVGTIAYAPVGWDLVRDSQTDYLFRYIEPRGGELRVVDNLSAPNPVMDLFITASTTSATFNFTPPPASFNSIDYYEVWIEEVGVYDPFTRFFPHKKNIEISGETINDLKPNTTYRAKLATCDVLLNGSGMSDNASFSNQITFTTL